MITLTKFWMALFAVALLFTATSCKNTAQGVGQDVENAGEKIQEKTR